MNSLSVHYETSCYSDIWLENSDAHLCLDTCSYVCFSEEKVSKGQFALRGLMFLKLPQKLSPDVISQAPNRLC